MLFQLDSKLQVHDWRTRADILTNRNQKVTVCMYDRPRKLYYIALTPGKFAKHLSPYVYRVLYRVEPQYCASWSFRAFYAVLRWRCYEWELAAPGFAPVWESTISTSEHQMAHERCARYYYTYSMTTMIYYLIVLSHTYVVYLIMSWYNVDEHLLYIHARQNKYSCTCTLWKTNEPVIKHMTWPTICIRSYLRINGIDIQPLSIILWQTTCAICHALPQHHMHYNVSAASIIIILAAFQPYRTPATR